VIAAFDNDDQKLSFIIIMIIIIIIITMVYSWLNALLCVVDSIKSHGTSRMDDVIG